MCSSDPIISGLRTPHHPKKEEFPDGVLELQKEAPINGLCKNMVLLLLQCYCLNFAFVQIFSCFVSYMFLAINTLLLFFIYQAFRFMM